MRGYTLNQLKYLDIRRYNYENKKSGKTSTFLIDSNYFLGALVDNPAAL